MKKSMLILVSLLLLACMPALADAAITPGPGDLTQEEAVRIATERFSAACGYDEAVLAEFTVGADLWEACTNHKGVVPRCWQVAFYYRENANVYYTVSVASPSGEVISVVPEDFSARLKECKKNAEEKAAAIKQGKSWMAEKGPWRLWSYQDKAAFISAYGRDPDGYPRQDIGLPDDEDIPLGQAVSIAKTVIVREFGETAERLDLFKLDCAFSHQMLLPNGTISRGWVIVFRDIYENGLYQPFYDANILSPSGEADRITFYERDYPAGETETVHLKIWPPEPGTTAPPVTVESDIYYNPRGGKYYHADVKCPSVHEKYLPLTLIDQSRMHEAQYGNLLPCPVCASQK